MGPLATADLFTKIVSLTEAPCDQEHLHILIDNNTAIPDRTKAILSGGEDPLPQLKASALRLQAAGADFLIMPCNTAHYFHEALSRETELPVLNMLEETARFIRSRGVRRVGLLATDGTIRSGVYERALTRYGIEVLCPDEDGQKAVMSIIYEGIKAGNTALSPEAFIRAGEDLLSRGAQTLILGCTELPPAFSLYNIDLPHTDPTLVLAAAAVNYAGARCKPLGDIT